jgi:hypothetical protein
VFNSLIQQWADSVRVGLVEDEPNRRQLDETALDQLCAEQGGPVLVPVGAPPTEGDPPGLPFYDLGGGLVSVAYTSRQALVAACGPDQPWVAVERARLAEALAGVGVQRVLLDTRVESDPAASYDAGPSGP